MAEAGKAVSDYLDNGNNIAYVNVMNRLSVNCDGHPSEPDMHDIGILASTDLLHLIRRVLILFIVPRTVRHWFSVLNPEMVCTFWNTPKKSVWAVVNISW